MATTTSTSTASDPFPVRRSALVVSATASERGKLTLCRTACTNCNLRELCPPCCGLSPSEMKAAEPLVSTRVRIRRGESLYLAGDRFTALYAVRHGFLKTTAILEKGRDQVTGFSMTGEVLGMDGIEGGKHTCNTRALEDSEVCAISFVRLQNLAAAIPRLQRHFHMLMSREIVREHEMMLLLGSMSADQRMAMFLLDLSRRFAAQGGSASEFKLRPTRDDIGSYLGLTSGTISRTFTKFDEAGLIAVRRRSVRILDQVGLERMGGQTLR